MAEASTGTITSAASFARHLMLEHHLTTGSSRSTAASIGCFHTEFGRLQSEMVEREMIVGNRSQENSSHDELATRPAGTTVGPPQPSELSRDVRAIASGLADLLGAPRSALSRHELEEHAFSATNRGRLQNEMIANELFVRSSSFEQFVWHLVTRGRSSDGEGDGDCYASSRNVRELRRQQPLASA